MKKIMIIFLVVLQIMIISTNAQAQSFSDISGHWAEEAIIKWSDYGVINGYDGKFSPNSELTRAQMATILSNLLGLTQKSENIYGDVQNDAWYADAILKCTHAGIMSGDGKNANPDYPITREQAMVMIARALKVKGEYNLSRRANDLADISSWATEYVYALYNNEYINGVGNDMIMPKANITRAAIITIFNNMIPIYISSPGEYDVNDGYGYTVLKGNGITIKTELSDLRIIISDEYTYNLQNVKKEVQNNNNLDDKSHNSGNIGGNFGGSNITPINKYTVSFYDKDNKIISQKEVQSENTVIPPVMEEYEGFVFDGWDNDFRNIMADKQIKSLWVETANYSNYFTLPSICGGVAENIKIPLSLTGNVDLCGFDLVISFDPEIVEFVAFENEDDDVVLNYNKETGLIHANLSSTKNVVGEIDICNLVFKILKPDKSTLIDINVKEAIKVLENGDFEKLNCNIHNCKIETY